MRLLRLLTAGSSLVGLHESMSRYRMGDPRSMPKFGSEQSEAASSMAIKPRKKSVRQAPGTQKRSGRLGRWISGLSASVLRPREPAKPAIGPLAKQAVQGEL